MRQKDYYIEFSSPSAPLVLKFLLTAGDQRRLFVLLLFYLNNVICFSIHLYGNYAATHFSHPVIGGDDQSSIAVVFIVYTKLSQRQAFK
jgi:hypothetical protein